VDAIRFDGRVAVVTGAGRGIGRAEAIALARRGARVVVNDDGSALDGLGRSEEPATTVVGEIRSFGGEAVASFDSVASDDGPPRVIETAMETFGRIDVLVSNAGNASHRRFEALDRAHLDHMWRTHQYGPFLLTMAAWPHMVGQGHGRVLLTSSTGGLYGDTTHIDYAAAKTAMIGFARSMVREAAESGITVNVLCPCAYTRMVAAHFAPDHSARDWFQAATPEAIAEAVAWLVHEDCSASGEMFGVYGAHVVRHVIGSNRGYLDPDLSAETVRAHWNEVMALDDLRFSPDIEHEFARVADAWRTAAGASGAQASAGNERVDGR
jgi:NAD(P)-dependent dehydrogenase (short-subunit alcohol dehydrogenase family)